MTVDLRSLLPPVRDQGRRGTCLSIAVNDGHHAIRSKPPTLSIDYLHYQAVQRDEGSNINNGVSIEAIRQALLEAGHPAESECPYSSAPRPSDWVPAHPEGDVWRRVTIEPAPTWGFVHSTLSAKRPIVIVLSITDEFYEPVDGVVSDTAGTSRARHAVLGVGLHATEARVLVRNCWGEEWGVGGHAWLSATYLQARCSALVTFGEMPT
jgi:hypothetical protein